MKSQIIKAIVLLAVFFRFWKLDSVPPSASLDEAAIGYNAYSILTTGADEYKEKFPLILRAYDDWRPALYVYLVIPFIKLFGLNVTAVRLPSVFLSVISVTAVYFLAKKIFERSEKSEDIALASALFLAISPWHIYISRLGHEVNAGLAFLIMSVLFFLYQRYIVSFIFFALSVMSYQSEKIIIPIMFVIFSLLFWKEIWKEKISFLIGLLVVLPILVPFLLSSLKPEAMIRFQATNVFSAEQEKFNKRALKLADTVKQGDIIGQILNNRRLVGLEIAADQYFLHFKPAWLFSNTGREPHKVPNLGVLYIWESVLIIFGLIYFYKAKIERRNKIFILLWFLSAPIPAAITTGAPHAMRSYTFLPIWQIFGACGFVFLLNLAGRYKKIVYCGFLLSVLFSAFYFYKNYFSVFPKNQSDSFQYALSKAIPYVLENEDKHEKIVFSNKDALYQSYMFFLFYSKYDPFLYQKQGGTVSGGYAETHKIGKFEFRPIEWENEEKSADILYVGNAEEIEGKILQEFRDLNNITRIKIKNG